jgi:hypothetical protein
VVTEIIQPICKIVKALIENKNVEPNKLRDLLQQLQSLADVTDKCIIQHTREMQLALNGLYVEPKEYVVGTRTDTKFSARLGFSEE